MSTRIDQLCGRLDRQWTQGEVGSDEWAGTAIEIIKMLAVQVGELTERVTALEADSRQADGDELNPVRVMEAGETVRDQC